MANTRHQALNIYLDDRQRLISLACSIVENRSVAEEIVQESWLRWVSKQYPQDQARPIFRRIVANLALDWGRRRTREIAILKDFSLVRSPLPSSEHVVMARQDLRRVVAALQVLPKRSVSAFRMHMFGGKTYEQIGKRLRISRSRAYEIVEDTVVHLALSLED